MGYAHAMRGCPHYVCALVVSVVADEAPRCFFVTCLIGAKAIDLFFMIKALKLLAYIPLTSLVLLFLCFLADMGFLLVFNYFSTFWTVVFIVFFAGGFVWLGAMASGYTSMFLSKLDSYPKITKYITFPIFFYIGGTSIFMYWRIADTGVTKEFIAAAAFTPITAYITLMYWAASLKDKNQTEI